MMLALLLLISYWESFLPQLGVQMIMAGFRFMSLVEEVSHCMLWNDYSTVCQKALRSKQIKDQHLLFVREREEIANVTKILLNTLIIIYRNSKKIPHHSSLLARWIMLECPLWWVVFTIVMCMLGEHRFIIWSQRMNKWKNHNDSIMYIRSKFRYMNQSFFYVWLM